MLNRPSRTGYSSSVSDAMRLSRERPDYPQMMADFLHGTFLTKDSDLLYQCLYELFEHVNKEIGTINRREYPEIFKKISNPPY